jgi:hypothetical protein
MDSRESRWLPTVLGAAKGKVRPGLARWISRLDDTAPDRVERGIGVRYVPRHATRCARRCRCGAPQRPAFGLLLLQRHRRACGRACLALFVFPVSFMPHSPSRTARSTKCAPSPDRGSRRSRRRPPSSSSCRSCNTQTGKPRPTSPRPAPSHSIHASLHAPPPPPQSHSSDAHEASGSVLGLVPHQLRGFLAQFRTLLVTGAAYDRRTGCSETVLRAYEGGGFGMLLRAFTVLFTRVGHVGKFVSKHVPSFIHSACSTTRQISSERLPLNSHTASDSVPCRPIEIERLLVISVFSGSEFYASKLLTSNDLTDMRKGRKTSLEMQWAIVRLSRIIPHDEISMGLNVSTRTIR